MSTGNEDPSPGGPDWDLLARWGGSLFNETGAAPISFSLGGERAHGIPATFAPLRRARRLTSTVHETVVLGRQPGSGLEVRLELLSYVDHPVLEWAAWFSNTGDRPSDVLEDVLALDAFLPGDGPSLRHCNGDFNSGDGYTWLTSSLRPGERIETAPQLGRPCDQAFPYFRLLVEGGGINLAVGWPGQWRAAFGGVESGFTAQAGQQDVRLRLLPGETIRTPRITLMAFSGNEERAVNLWRRWYREHVMPRPGGKPMAPLLHVAGTDEGPPPGDEFTGATEENQLEYQRRFAEHGIDYDVWWVDAGWYPCVEPESGDAEWRVTGTWKADPKRFPRGLAPVSAGASRHGARLLLWFEPERVFPGTALSLEHPEWVLPPPSPPSEEEGTRRWRQRMSGLLDLSDRACAQMLTDLVSGLIDEYGIGVYRQDFNFWPLAIWRGHDGEDRRGLTENLYVQGYLQFWDDLLSRHRGIFIDSCASGGRRNDLETMRRSVPLHYSDFGYGLNPVKVDFQRTMYEWLPYFKDSSIAWDLADAQAAGLSASEQDSYSFHCALAPMIGLGLDVHRFEDYDLELVRRMLAIWRRAAPLLLDGDFYALTPPGRSGKEWVGRQFCSRDGGQGFLQAIRHAGSDEANQVLRPRRLRPEAQYSLEEAETGEHRELLGSALLEQGLRLDLPARRGSIWFYRELA